MSKLFNVDGLPDYKNAPYYMAFEKHFTITGLPSVYTAVGEILETCQRWEKTYKDFAKELGAKIKGVDNSSLNKINRELCKKGYITQTQKDNLEKIIMLKNYFSHEFYTNEFDNCCGDYKKIGEILNDCWFLFCEATDYICNMSDNVGKLEREQTRPTIFD